MHRSPWLAWGGLLSGAALIGIAACGSDSESAPPTTTGSGASTAMGGGGSGAAGASGGSGGVGASGANGGGGSTPVDPELVTLSDFELVGAFRVPADDFGISSMNYAQGPIAYDPVANSIYIVGHTYQQAIAEFEVPNLVNSTTLSDLEMAGDPVQTFASVLDRVSGGNPEALDSIGGMTLLPGSNGPELVVNAYEYYDAPADNTLTTLVIRDPHDLAGSAVEGFYRFEGGAGHTSGWLSPVPTSWQDELGGSFITGQSSGIPIISRCSVGPSAFAFDPIDLGAPVPDPIPTVLLLDFSLGEPLAEDLSNETLDNDLWTHLSRVVYGFVPPGTRSYVTLGHSGGHESGVCYKCTQDDGNLCGGYCSPDADDNYLYYWLWDVDDLLAVRAGQMAASAVRPYEWGEFPALFPTTELGGGSFDPASGRLFLTLQRADDEQGAYSNPPVVVVYQFQADS